MASDALKGLDLVTEVAPYSGAFRAADRWTFGNRVQMAFFGVRRVERVLNFLKQFFTWWNGQTLGLRWYTARKGEFVGEDEFGNKYYRAPSALPESIPERRWVVYKSQARWRAMLLKDWT